MCVFLTQGYEYQLCSPVGAKKHPRGYQKTRREAQGGRVVAWRRRDGGDGREGGRRKEGGRWWERGRRHNGGGGKESWEAGRRRCWGLRYSPSSPPPIMDPPLVVHLAPSLKNSLTQDKNRVKLEQTVNKSSLIPTKSCRRCLCICQWLKRQNSSKSDHL